MSRLILQPPEIQPVEGQVVFLGGPIQDAPDWQSQAIKLLDESLFGFTIASPRRDYLPGDFVYEKQVDWETEYLNRAARVGVIMFWLAGRVAETPGRAYAQTSRFELGEWKMRHERDGAKLVVGIEESFGNARYIRRRFSQDCPDITIHDSLADTCAGTLEQLSR